MKQGIKWAAVALFSGAIGLSTARICAAAATVPSAVRGTWYLKVPADPLLHEGSYLSRITYKAHSASFQSHHSKPFVVKGKSLAVTNLREKFRFRGGKFHTVTVHAIGEGDVQGMISTHLRINGKRQPVLLGEPQQGHSFDVFTHFKPAKHYHVTGYLKH